MIREELRPMDIGMMLDKTFRLCFSNLKKYLKVFLIYFAVFLLFSLIIAGIFLGFYFFNGKSFEKFSDPKVILPFLIFMIPIFILIFIVLLIIWAFYTGMIYDLFVKSFLGEEWNFKDSFKYVKSKIFSIIISYILIFFILIGGYMMCCIGILPMMAFITMVLPALMFENISASNGISRSFKLASYSFWRVLGSKLLMGIIVGALSIIFQVFFQFISMFGISMNLFTGQYMNVWIAIIAAVYILYLMYTIVANALTITFNIILFFNQKIKFENFGVEQLAERMISEHKSKTTKKSKGDENKS